MKIRICIALVAALIVAKPVVKAVRRALERASIRRDNKLGRAALLELDVLRILGYPASELISAIHAMDRNGTLPRRVTDIPQYEDDLELFFEELDAAYDPFTILGSTPTPRREVE